MSLCFQLWLVFTVTQQNNEWTQDLNQEWRQKSISFKCFIIRPINCAIIPPSTFKFWYLLFFLCKVVVVLALFSTYKNTLFVGSKQIQTYRNVQLSIFSYLPFLFLVHKNHYFHSAYFFFLQLSAVSSTILVYLSLSCFSFSSSYPASSPTYNNPDDFWRCLLSSTFSIHPSIFCPLPIRIGRESPPSSIKIKKFV